MAAPLDLHFIGWDDDDDRYTEEKRRVTMHIKKIAMERGFTYALVQDMLIKRRYRSFGLHVSVAFKKTEWVQGKVPKYVLARLYFNEDADLARAPEWFDEIEEK